MTIKTTDKAGDKPEDRLPEPDDDIEVQAAADPAPQDEPAAAPEPQREEEEKPLSPREALVQLYRQKRDRELAQKARAEQETDEETEADAADAADEPPPAPSAKATAPAAQPAATPPAPAEKATDPAIDAVRTLLEETRAVLEEAKAVRVAPAAPQAQAEPESEPETKAAAPALDEARLEEIVERIQIGDKAEGRQALAELIEIMGSKVTPGMQPDEIARVVQTQIAQDRIAGEMTHAVHSFRDKYKGIAEDADLLDASIRRLNGELRADLVKAGVPEKDLRGLDSERLMQIHNQARIIGRVQRGYGEIFDAVGTAVHSKFANVLGGAPAQTPTPAPRTPSTPAAPPSVVADRVDRKRALSVQPRAAGVRSESQPQQKPKSRAEIVADMRRARGFKI